MPWRISGSMRLCATIVSKSFPPTETPCHLSTLRSNLRLCPTFSMRSDSSTGRNSSRTRRASAALLRQWQRNSRCAARRRTPARPGAPLWDQGWWFRCRSRRSRASARSGSLRPLGRRGHQVILMRHIGNGLEVRRRRSRLRFRFLRRSLRLRHQHQLLARPLAAPSAAEGFCTSGLLRSAFLLRAPP